MKRNLFFLAISLFFAVFSARSELLLNQLINSPDLLYPSSPIALDLLHPRHATNLDLLGVNKYSGDINGDGLNDIIIRWKDFGIKTAVLFGTKNGTLPDRTLLDGKNGFYIVCTDEHPRYIASVDFIGDVNGDGLNDLLLVAGLTTSDVTFTAYLIYGSKNFDDSINVLEKQWQGAKFETINPAFFPPYSPSLGRVPSAVIVYSPLGDVNRDGLADFAIGLSIFFGSKNFSSSISLNGTNGFSITSEFLSEQPALCFGSAISGPGDINNDGFHDIMISSECNEASIKGAGKVYVVFGRETFPASLPIAYINNPSFPKGLIIDSQTDNEYFGSSILSPGDLNDDHIPDMLISSMLPDQLSGGTYIIFGGEGLTGTLSKGIIKTLNMGIFIPGVGHTLEAIGDINQDGFPDIVATKDKIASVIYGGPSLRGDLNVSTLNATNGFNLKAPDHLVIKDFMSRWNEVKDIRIYKVKGLGDINGDSIPDYAIEVSFEGWENKQYLYDNIKGYIITGGVLSETPACLGYQYCVKPQIKNYLSSMLCNTNQVCSSVDVINLGENDKSAANANFSAYNPITQGIYSLDTEKIVSKDNLSPGLAALLGAVIGSVITLSLSRLVPSIKIWYQAKRYHNLNDPQDEVSGWNRETCQSEYNQIELRMKSSFSWYSCLLWTFVIIGVVHIIANFVGYKDNGVPSYLLILFQVFIVYTYYLALRAKKKEIISTQRRVVKFMSIIMVLFGLSLVIAIYDQYPTVEHEITSFGSALAFGLGVIGGVLIAVACPLFIYLEARRLLFLMQRKEHLAAKLQNNTF